MEFSRYLFVFAIVLGQPQTMSNFSVIDYFRPHLTDLKLFSHLNYWIIMPSTPWNAKLLLRVSSKSWEEWVTMLFLTRFRWVYFLSFIELKLIWKWRTGIRKWLEWIGRWGNSNCRNDSGPFTTNPHSPPISPYSALLALNPVSIFPPTGRIFQTGQLVERLQWMETSMLIGSRLEGLNWT